MPASKQATSNTTDDRRQTTDDTDNRQQTTDNRQQTTDKDLQKQSNVKNSVKSDFAVAPTINNNSNNDKRRMMQKTENEKSL